MRSRVPELSLAVAVGFAACVATYAVSRVAQTIFFPEPDPALVVWSTRIAMYWRLAIGAYVAAMTAPIAYVWARRDLAEATRVVGSIVVVTSIFAAVQGVFFP